MHFPCLINNSIFQFGLLGIFFAKCKKKGILFQRPFLESLKFAANYILEMSQFYADYLTLTLIKEELVKTVKISGTSLSSPTCSTRPDEVLYIFMINV